MNRALTPNDSTPNTTGRGEGWAVVLEDAPALPMRDVCACLQRHADLNHEQMIEVTWRLTVRGQATVVVTDRDRAKRIVNAMRNDLRTAVRLVRL